MTFRAGRVAAAGLMWCVGAVAWGADGLDPAAWGSDHVGKKFPEYVTGEECLFCHRFEVGTGWQPNRHNNAMHIVVDDSDPAVQALKGNAALSGFADELLYLVGHTRMKRYLKAGEGYGKAAMLSAGWMPPKADGDEGRFVDAENPHWNETVFAERCAGCHATAVLTNIKAFSTFSNDCFVCHGDVVAQHNSDTSLVYFGKGNSFGAQAEMSICASCHLRGGKSKSSGLPYANTFVPGDNLFRDFEVDLSEEFIAGLNPSDRHVYANVRDVVVDGKEELTCMTCHDVHEMSTRKHRVLKRLERAEYCVICHDNTEDYSSLVKYEVHSAVCEY